MPSPGTEGLDETGGDGGSSGTLSASGSVGISGTFGNGGTSAAPQGGSVGVSGSGSGTAGHGGTGGSSAGGSTSGGTTSGGAGGSVAGTGGMVSVGGGTGTLGCTHLQPGGTLGLQVKYMAEATDPSVPYIYFDIEIDNLDDTPVALTDLHYRYYFNNDLTTPITDFYSPLVKHANGNTENLGANDLKATYTPTYLEVTFTSALSLLKTENVAFKVHMHSDPTPGMHSQASDYSFNGPGPLAPSCKEILYQQTALAWGTPPP